MPVGLRPSLSILLVAMMAFGSTAAWAQDRHGNRRPPDLGRMQDRREPPDPRQDHQMGPPPDIQPRPTRRDEDLSDSVRRIERSTRGQVLGAERMQSDGREINRIKILDGRGRVRVYMDDPEQRRPPPPTRDDDN